MLNELIGAVIQVVIFALIPVIIWFITARKKETFFYWIGFRRPAQGKWLKTVFITVVLATIYIMITNLSVRILPDGVTTAGAQFAGMGASALPAVFIYAFVRTALSEEILFRGFILKCVERKFGFAMGNTVQAFLFGLMHGVPFGLATGSVWAFLLLTMLPGLFGAYMGWMNEKKFGGSIIPSWILHGCMNFMTAIMSFM